MKTAVGRLLAAGFSDAAMGKLGLGDLAASAFFRHARARVPLHRSCCLRNGREFRSKAAKDTAYRRRWRICSEASPYHSVATAAGIRLRGCLQAGIVADAHPGHTSPIEPSPPLGCLEASRSSNRLRELIVTAARSVCSLPGRVASAFDLTQDLTASPFVPDL